MAPLQPEGARGRVHACPGLSVLLPYSSKRWCQKRSWSFEHICPLLQELLKPENQMAIPIRIQEVWSVSELCGCGP